MRARPTLAALTFGLLALTAASVGGCGRVDPPAEDAGPVRRDQQPAPDDTTAILRTASDPDVLARTVATMEEGLGSDERRRFVEAVGVLKLAALLDAGLGATITEAVRSGGDVPPPDTLKAFAALARRLPALGVEGAVAEADRQKAAVVRRMGDAAGDAAREAVRRALGRGGSEPATDAGR